MLTCNVQRCLMYKEIVNSHPHYHQKKFSIALKSGKISKIDERTPWRFSIKREVD